MPCRWLEEELPEGVKWRTLEHNGVMFPPDYVRLPPDVHLKYDGVLIVQLMHVTL